MRRLGIFLLLLLLPLAAAAEVRYVQVEKARLLKRPSAFSTLVATLPYRTKVEVLSPQGAFFSVQTKLGKGYIAAASLTVNQPKFTSQSSAGYVSSDEVATATKGFNAQVESEYRQKNPSLPYAMLDRLEAQTHCANPQATYQAFRKQGKLGEFQPGGGEQ
jgi:hypothetical protein